MPFLAIFKTFFSNSTNVIIVVLIAIAALIIIPNSQIILERFGFETRATLKADLVNEKRNNEVLVSAIENNAAQGAIKKETDTIADTKSTEMSIENKKIDTETKSVIKKKDQKIKQIIPVDESKLTQAEKDDIDNKVSEVAIDEIWSSYCSIDKSNCSPGVSS